MLNCRQVELKLNPTSGNIHGTVSQLQWTESSSANAFPRCGDTVCKALDWAPWPCMVLLLPSAKLNQSQQQVYTSITTPRTANEMFCINTTWHLITHCEMDDLFFWAYWKTGMRLCCQKFKWRRKFKNNTYPFLLVMLMPFPVRWLGGYLDLKIISKTEPCFPALQDPMYVDETASMPHKAIFYNHTKFSSGVLWKHFWTVQPNKEKKRKERKEKTGRESFCFPVSFIRLHELVLSTMKWNVAAPFELFPSDQDCVADGPLNVLFTFPSSDKAFEKYL